MNTRLIFFALAFFSSAAHAASFDCTKASNFVEKAICTDSILGKLDDALSENYKYMLASNIGDGARKDLRATQKQWLSERNKCTSNKCVTEAYRKRIDEVCDYPVLSGMHPNCKSAAEVEAGLGESKQPQAIAQPHKETVPPQTDGAKNLERIKQLKLPANFINSTIYVNYLGQWVDYMPVSKWIGLLFENKKIESLQSISGAGNTGVSIKRPGRPSFGLLFKIEGKEAYLTAFVVDNQVNPIRTPGEHSQMAAFVQSLTSAETMD